MLLVPQAGNIRVYDFRSMTEVVSLPAGNTQNLIDISPDDRVLVVVSAHREKFITDIPNAVIPTSSFYRIQHYEIGTWTLLSESKVIPSDEETEYGFFNVCFSRDGNQLVASGMSREKQKRKTIAEVHYTYGLFAYDLSLPNGKWRYIGANTLPLHPDGKYLLDGRPGSATLTGVAERLGRTVYMPDAHL